MSNFRFDSELVIKKMIEYFYIHGKEKCTSISMEKLYSEVVKYATSKNKKLKMPSFAQGRKIIISYLSDEGVFNKNERLTSEKAYQLAELYYSDEDIEDLLEYEYNTFIHYDSVIVCTLKLPPYDILDALATGFSERTNKSEIYGRINVIQKLCYYIKKRNPELILAVVSESNRMIHFNENGKINGKMKSLNPICDTLCMFVKNTQEGREFVEKMKPLTHSLTDTLTE